MRRMEVEPGTDAAADARCGAGAGTAADGGNDKRSTVTTIAVFAPEVAHPREAAAAKAAATPTSAASSAARRKRAARAAAAAAAEQAVELARGRDGGFVAARPPPCGPRAVRPGSGPEAPARRALRVRGTRRKPSRSTARRPPQPPAPAPPPHLLPAAPWVAPAMAARPPSPRPARPPPPPSLPLYLPADLASDLSCTTHRRRLTAACACARARGLRALRRCGEHRALERGTVDAARRKRGLRRQPKWPARDDTVQPGEDIVRITREMRALRPQLVTAAAVNVPARGARRGKATPLEPGPAR